MNVLDRIKSGESVVCDYFEREAGFQPGLCENKKATAELFALAGKTVDIPDWEGGNGSE